MVSSKSYVSLTFAALCCIFSNPVRASDDECQPITWVNKRDLHDRAVTSTVTSKSGSSTVTSTVILSTSSSTSSSKGPKYTPSPSTNGSIAVGQVNCRFWDYTEGKVNYYTCTLFAQTYGISTDLFFLLNPQIKKDCSNIATYSEYCVQGYIQPPESEEGFCGPQHGNATCLYTNAPCCNSKTWKCGATPEDCADGVCWEGFCAGHTVYSVDGKCGPSNGNLLCAGKWGDCCNKNGICGTGAAFCGTGNCQSGNCTMPAGAGMPKSSSGKVPGNSPDGTCGGSKGYTCGVLWGECCNKSGFCGDLPQDCAISSGCQSKFGTCDGGSVSTGTTVAATTSTAKLTTTASSTSKAVTSVSATTSLTTKKV